MTDNIIGSQPEPRVRTLQEMEQNPWRWVQRIDPQSGEYNVYMTDSNYLGIIPNSSEVAITGMRFIIRNRFAQMPLCGHHYASTQFIGRDTTEVSLQLATLGDNFQRELQSMVEELEHNSREFRRIRGAGSVKLEDNELLGILGIDQGIISSVDSEPDPNSTNIYRMQLSFTTDGHLGEELQQEQYQPSEIRRRVADILLRYIDVRNFTLGPERPYRRSGLDWFDITPSGLGRNLGQAARLVNTVAPVTVPGALAEQTSNIAGFDSQSALALREAGRAIVDYNIARARSYAEGRGVSGAHRLRNIIIPNGGRESNQYGAYVSQDVSANYPWLAPHLTTVADILNRHSRNLPYHDFYVGNSRGVYLDVRNVPEATQLSPAQVRDHAHNFTEWPDMFRPLNGESSRLSQMLYGFRTSYQSTQAITDYLMAIQAELYEVAAGVLRSSHEDGFDTIFPNIVQDARRARRETVHPTYQDLELPPHPYSGLEVDTEPDFIFFNDGEEALLTEVGPDLDREIQERITAMETTFGQLSGGETWSQTYLGRSRIGPETLSDFGTISPLEQPPVMEAGPGGADIDPTAQTERSLDSDSDQQPGVIQSCLRISSLISGFSGNTEAENSGGVDNFEIIIARRHEMFKNSIYSLPDSDEMRTQPLNIGPLDTELSDNADRGHLVSRARMRELVRHSIIQNPDKTLTMRRAFPSFKIYFLEDDTGARREHLVPRTVLYLDDFYNYNSIMEIRCIRTRKSPIALLVVKLTNVSGLLERRTWITNREVQREIYAPGFEGTELENPLKKLVLKEGLKVQARLGSTNDPNKMDNKFIGEVVEISYGSDSNDEITIVCQSYGGELILDPKGVSEDSRIIFNDTADLLHTIMCSPELAHFGRFDLNPEFNPAEARAAASSRDEGIITNLNLDNLADRALMRMVVKNRSQWLLANNPADDNIYCPTPADTREQGAIAQAEAATAQIARQGGNFFDWLANRAESGISIVTLGNPIYSTIGSALPSGIAWLLHRVASYYTQVEFQPTGQTIWEIFKEMELRHPGWIAHPRPYGTRETMFFGIPSQQYWADQISEDELNILRMAEGRMEGEQEANRRQRMQHAGMVEHTIGTPVGNLTLWREPGHPLNPIAVANSWARYIGQRAVNQAQNSLALEGLGERIGRTFGRFRPFRRYHLLTSEHHILKNNIRASDKGTFNTVVLQYGDGKVYTMKADDNIPDYKTKTRVFRFDSCTTEVMARRYCVGLLMRHLKDVYKGEIIVTGMNVDPLDVCFIFDRKTGMFGPVEVEQVVDTFTPETGWITEITPDLIVGTNEWVTSSTRDAMGAVMSQLYAKYLEPHVTAGRAIGAGAGTATILGLGSTSVAGAGVVAFAAGAYLTYLGGYYLIRWSQDRQPIWMCPLILGERPYFAGLDGFRQDGIFSSIRGRIHAEIDAVTEGWRVSHLGSYLNDISVASSIDVGGQSGAI